MTQGSAWQVVAWQGRTVLGSAMQGSTGAPTSVGAPMVPQRCRPRPDAARLGDARRDEDGLGVVGPDTAMQCKGSTGPIEQSVVPMVLGSARSGRTCPYGAGHGKAAQREGSTGTPNQSGCR
jgi:hypothetical protein